MGCGASILAGGKRHAYILDSEEPPDASSFLPHTDFEIGALIQTGGVGRVHRGIRKFDMRPVALKLFGYTPRIPSEAEIYKEIRHMQALSEIPGCIQLLGIFQDTNVGLVSGKLTETCFPVLVMELVEGGDFLQRVFENRMVSEKILSQLFKGLIESLIQIHEKGFLHRDIKLENLLFCKFETFSLIKIIDLGMMIQLPPNQHVYVSDGLQGTPGYLAPESVLAYEYSAATDLWQAGCCLYTMLSADSAFSDDNLKQITEGTFNPMSGFSWIGVSDDAKDLVCALLTKDKALRINAKDALNHPWIVNTTAGINMEKEYYARIKALALRRSLREVFKRQNILIFNTKRKEALLEHIQKARDEPISEDITSNNSLSHAVAKPQHPRSISVTTVAPHSPPPVKTPQSSKISPSPRSLFSKPAFFSGDSDATMDMTIIGDPIFQTKIKAFKQVVLTRFFGEWTSGEVSSAIFPTLQWPVQMPTYSLSLNEFIDMASEANLTELANINAFNVFDIDEKGSIHVLNFLLGLLAAKSMPKITTPVPTPKGSQKRIPIDPDIIAAAQLYFDLFQIKESAHIELQELKFIVGLLLNDELLEMSADELIATETHIDNIFLTMNISKSGMVDFEEFKRFFSSIMLTTSKLRYSRASLQEVLRNRKSIITE